MDVIVVDRNVGGARLAKGWVIIWRGAGLSEAIGTTVQGSGEVSETVTILTVKSHLNISESVLSEVAVTLF